MVIQIASDDKFNVGIFGYLGSILGVSGDQVKFLFAVLLPIPFGFIIRAINGAKTRLYSMLILGLFLQYFIFGYSIKHSFL